MMPVPWISIRSAPWTLPDTRPTITTLLALISACTVPLAPTVSWLLGRSTFPSTLPSITMSSLPVRSPLIEIDFPMFATAFSPWAGGG
jgi:hypothetical protein